MTQENIPVKTGLLDLLRLSQGVQFFIPAYQRNYTWTANKEVKQLLDDITAVLVGERSKHFIGIMIYLEKALSPYKRERSVIDGQQRLTTMFLTLYAIKEIMLERGLKEDAKKLETLYMINLFDESNKYKLKPLVSDDDVYQKIVNREFEKIKGSQSKVWLNFNYIKTYIIKLIENYELDKIIEAVNKLYLVCVPIGDDDYPQKIFESINATGSKLTASDLIRNFILMPLQSDLQELFYEKYWKELEKLVSADSNKLESFFRLFIIAKRQVSIQKNAVYKAFTEWHDDNFESFGTEGIFKEVLKYAKYHNDLYKAPTSTLDQSIRKSVDEFRSVLSEMPASLLMEMYRLYDQQKISGEQLNNIITILNAYLLRRYLCGIDTSVIAHFFPIILKETFAECNGYYQNIVDIFKKNLVNRNKGTAQEMPDNKKLFDRIRNANMYNLKTWLSVLFNKLESEGNPAPVDFSHLSIEHLMPQTATPEWLSTLSCSKEEYEENVHRLGNLTLAARADNSKMGNKVWGYKNKVLESTAHLKMNQDLYKKDNWSLKDIEDRTEFLIGEIARLYPYFELEDSKINKISICIDKFGIYAQGIFYPDNGCVEILEGSTIYTEMPTADKYPDIEALRAELKEEGIIGERDGNLTFLENYTVYAKNSKLTGLSAAASIILHGNRSGYEQWRTEEGKALEKVIS